MIYQTDPTFPSSIQHWGCYFLSLLWHLNDRFSLGIFTFPEVMRIYTHETGDFDIGPECYLQNPQGVCDEVVPGKVKYLGKQGSIYTCASDEFEVQRWHNPNTDFFHFVAAKGGHVVYDSIEGGSRTVREGACDGKRIFKVL